MNVLGFFTGELKQRPYSIIVAGKLRAGVVDDVRQDEFFHQAEHGEILMAANLIQRPLFFWGKKRQLPYLRQRFRHERLGKIQPLVPADNIFDTPADPLRCLKRALIAVIVLHDHPPLDFFLHLSMRPPKPNSAKRANADLLANRREISDLGNTRRAWRSREISLLTRSRRRRSEFS